jgi:hypothetical protein
MKTKLSDPFWSHVDNLVVAEQNKKLDPEMVKFLEGVVGCCEADSYSQHMLWYEYHDTPRFSKKYSWEQINPGWSDTVGWIGKNPVCISLYKVKVDGHIILFYYAMSRFVDHDMVRAWLEKYMPDTARDPQRGDSLRNSDAMNFSNCLPR